MPAFAHGTAIFRPARDNSLLIYFDQQISLAAHQQVAKLLRLLELRPIFGIVNLHPAYCSVLVKFDVLKLHHDELETRLRSYLDRLDEVSLPEPRHREIPVCYGGEYGPDLAEVSEDMGSYGSPAVGMRCARGAQHIALAQRSAFKASEAAQSVRRGAAEERFCGDAALYAQVAPRSRARGPEAERLEFKREVERELTGKETEPWEIVYFKFYKSQIPVIEQAIETAALMLGTDKSRGYCLEMICADFLAGADLGGGCPDVLLESVSRMYKFLPGQQKQTFLDQIDQKAS